MVYCLGIPPNPATLMYPEEDGFRVIWANRIIKTYTYRLKHRQFLYGIHGYPEPGWINKVLPWGQWEQIAKQKPLLYGTSGALLSIPGTAESNSAVSRFHRSSPWYWQQPPVLSAPTAARWGQTWVPGSALAVAVPSKFPFNGSDIFKDSQGARGCGGLHYRSPTEFPLGHHGCQSELFQESMDVILGALHTFEGGGFVGDR